MFIVIVLATVLIGLWSADTFTRPIRLLTAIVQRIQGGDLNQIAPVTSHDEIGILSSAFNGMTTSLLETGRASWRRSKASSKASSWSTIPAPSNP